MIVDNVEKSDKRQLKQKYIPMCFRGEISIKQASEKIGIKYNSVWRLKKRFSQHGEAIFIHGNTGRSPKNTRHDDNAIFDFYKAHFDGSPFMVCRDYYSRFCSAVSYSKVYRVLTSHNILSPRARVPKAEKKKHLPRKEREYEGELLQIDGCTHRWLIGKGKTTIHGAVDDATHKITALYMAENECRLGYNELLRRTAEKCGGVPNAIYSDRSACFFTTKTASVSIEEQLSGFEKSPTQWQTLAKKVAFLATFSRCSVRDCVFEPSSLLCAINLSIYFIIKHKILFLMIFSKNREWEANIYIAIFNCMQYNNLYFLMP